MSIFKFCFGVMLYKEFPIVDSKGSVFAILKGPSIISFIIKFIFSLFIKTIDFFGFGLTPKECKLNLYMYFPVK